MHMPIVAHTEGCQPIPGESYTTQTAYPPGPHIPAEMHPDLNLAIQGWVSSSAPRQLVDYAGSHDANAPQFHGLFAQRRLPTFATAYQVYSWDWAHMRRGPLTAWPPVTALGLRTTPGETLHVPDSGYGIGNGYAVLVLYASDERITLKYTREDNVVSGYTFHVDGVCVEASLLALYQEDNRGERFAQPHPLPALRSRQAIGRAIGNKVVIAIRDTGTLMDPRSRLDWWRAY